MTKNVLLESILNVLPIGIMYCDNKCIIRFINKEYCNILGKSADEILGRNVKEIIPKSRVKNVLKSGISEYGDICVLPGKNTQNSAVVNRILLHSDQGNSLGVISHAFFGNVQDLQNLARKLTDKIKQLDMKIFSYQQYIQSALQYKYTLDSILGKSPNILAQKNLLEQYAKVESPVLILGETGTGKELFAHALHASSKRCEKPLVCINCAAIPKELFESELFGYVEGAFSGAHKAGKVGQVELSDGGTLFLDEIGDLAMDAQSKLLRFLESKTFCRVGSVKTQKVDFRLVSATNKDLPEMVANGKFREDLYYRINPLQIVVPPLRQRKEDIPLIIDHFLQSLDRSDLAFSDETIQFLTSYSWPGNIRALRNIITHAASICKSTKIEISHLPDWLRARIKDSTDAAENSRDGTVPVKPATSKPSLATIISQQEAKTLVDHLRKNGGNVASTARELGISRATLYNKLKKFGVDHRMILCADAHESRAM